ncbi:acetyltransferase [Scytonema hofmannii PCC 7110]|uniref:Acetyltransferase n=2 Tax=Scytonema hofmannii TaxID=34078 RepID=A0A139WXR1_9CYAN|nr:acetyltransferase [Scytonema hofmannii PCC 7110]
MFLKHKNMKTLIEVLTMPDLYNPFRQEIWGQSHAGEELQEPAFFEKSDLIFPSGESLPSCWLNPHYLEPNTLVNTLSAYQS